MHTVPRHAGKSTNIKSAEFALGSYWSRELAFPVAREKDASSFIFYTGYLAGGMQLNPNTKLVNLLIAIPSAASVCDGFHMAISGNENKSLEQLCCEYRITFASFLQAIENLDWDEEYQ